MNAYLPGELLEEISDENKNGELEGEEEKNMFSISREKNLANS